MKVIAFNQTILTSCCQQFKSEYNLPVGLQAQALSKGFTTLGQTRAGQNLAKLTADMPYYPGSPAYKMWGCLSTQWAKGASGEINVFQNAAKGVDMQSIWRVYEYPALKANPNVTNIIFHY